MSGATNDCPNNPGHSNSSPNRPRVLAVLDLLTEAELIELNHRIVKRLRLMREIHAHDASRKCPGSIQISSRG